MFRNRTNTEHTMPQYQPGQSGNPKGRPKGARSVAKAFLEEIGQAAPLPAGKKGSGKNPTKLEAVVSAQIDKGMGGDNRAIEAVLARMDALQKEVRAANAPSFTSADREVIEEIHRRLTRAETLQDDAHE
jgi:hypothetical protein